jgi:hypothetical protein
MRTSRVRGETQKSDAWIQIPILRARLVQDTIANVADPGVVIMLLIDRPNSGNLSPASGLFTVGMSTKQCSNAGPIMESCLRARRRAFATEQDLHAPHYVKSRAPYCLRHLVCLSC